MELQDIQYEIINTEDTLNYFILRRFSMELQHIQYEIY